MAPDPDMPSTQKDAKESKEKRYTLSYTHLQFKQSILKKRQKKS